MNAKPSFLLAFALLAALCGSPSQVCASPPDAGEVLTGRLTSAENPVEPLVVDGSGLRGLVPHNPLEDAERGGRSLPDLYGLDGRP